jgi:general secretion pathway protein G
MRKPFNRNLRSPRRRAAGFTLIELLLVLVILAILMGVVVTKFTGRTQEARITAAKTTINNIGVALDAYEIDNGRYPTTDEGLSVLVQSSAQGGRSYLKTDTAPVDPWNNPFVYRSPGTNNPNGYDLYSLGPDGREGSDDIGNWTTAQ